MVALLKLFVRLVDSSVIDIRVHAEADEEGGSKRWDASDSFVPLVLQDQLLEPGRQGFEHVWSPRRVVLRFHMGSLETVSRKVFPEAIVQQSSGKFVEPSLPTIKCIGFTEPRLCPTRCSAPVGPMSD
eukprot:CAMPEP_0180828036 /NCGR_PEP_ID=MMETSP1038_2-20121128/74474_1 /TAXON_ID=632150 /ORGANISM="Azadinium spinosum, Strain 3D9" /LENGTH=127 /DNA_ID=CAMNT_0022870907 /DNA_START=169 /DNA_END=550 /DNA_ORIENTATION=-